MKLDLQSQKTTSLLVTIKTSLNFQRQIRLPCQFQNNNSCVFLNYTEINLFLEKLSNLIIAKLATSTRTDISLQTSVRQLRAHTMCIAFTPDYGCDNCSLNLIGDVYCPHTKCSDKLCLHKTRFNLLAEAIIKVRKARLCARCAKSNKIHFLVVCPNFLHF